MSGSLTTGALVTEAITGGASLTLASASGSIRIGAFSWPDANATVSPGDVMKTDSSGNLTFEPSNVRVAVNNPTYTIGTSDDIVAIVVAQAVTLTLPDPASKNVGDLIHIVKEVAGTDVVTISPQAPVLISGAASVALSKAYGTLAVYTNGVDYFALL